MQSIQNTLIAIEEGFNFCDSTLDGFGRGAGNAETEKFHTEQDQSYTVITVPQQHDMNWKKGNGANFEFYINSETCKKWFTKP